MLDLPVRRQNEISQLFLPYGRVPAGRYSNSTPSKQVLPYSTVHKDYSTIIHAYDVLLLESTTSSTAVLPQHV